MKEIKAYVRPTFLNSMIERLEEKGAKDITVVRVDALGALADQEFDRWHFVRKYPDKYFSIAKLEIVCRGDQAKEFMDAIKIPAAWPSIFRPVPACPRLRGG